MNYNIVNTSLRGKYFECEMSGITRYLCLGVTMFLLLRALVKKLGNRRVGQAPTFFVCVFMLFFYTKKWMVGDCLVSGLFEFFSNFWIFLTSQDP